MRVGIPVGHGGLGAAERCMPLSVDAQETGLGGECVGHTKRVEVQTVLKVMSGLKMSASGKPKVW
jgi:hypothetical protein